MFNKSPAGSVSNGSDNSGPSDRADTRPQTVSDKASVAVVTHPMTVQPVGSL